MKYPPCFFLPAFHSLAVNSCAAWEKELAGSRARLEMGCSFAPGAMSQMIFA